MNKISFTNMKLKADTAANTFNFGEHKVSVLKYLPINDKYDLIAITLQKSEENGVYNPLKVDLYFHLHLFYMYTNVSFTDKQKEDEFKLYDILTTSGLMESFLECLSKDEYNYLYEMLEKLMSEIKRYRYSSAATIQAFIQDLPKNAQAAADIVESFDKEKYKEVIEFAKAANGNRPV